MQERRKSSKYDKEWGKESEAGGGIAECGDWSPE